MEEYLVDVSLTTGRPIQVMVIAENQWVAREIASAQFASVLQSIGTVRFIRKHI